MTDSNVDLIVTQLQTILSAVTGVDQCLTYLPRFIDKNVTVGIYWDGADYESAEINSVWVNYKFQITAYLFMMDEVTIQTDQKDIALALISALRAKPSINSTCLYNRIDSLKNDFVKDSNGNVYATIEINITARKEEDV
ncbi:MAG: hypothetical protein ACYCXQ_00995 [Candidatus Humimicrobiaceae bacterium]